MMSLNQKQKMKKIEKMSEIEEIDIEEGDFDLSEEADLDNEDLQLLNNFFFIFQ